MPYPRDHKYTAEEFFKLTPESNSERYELINGDVLALASPTEIHQRLIGNLFFAIKSFINNSKGKCEPFVSPFDVKLDDENVVQPDVLVICDPSQLDGKRCNGAPDFIIEITSSNYAHDYIDKLELYRRTGVREYWIVDPLYEKVVVYCFDKSDFPNIYTFDSVVPVGIYDGKLSICVKDLT